MKKNTICQDQKKASPEATVTEVGKEENQKQGQEQKNYTTRREITVTALIEDKLEWATPSPPLARRGPSGLLYHLNHGGCKRPKKKKKKKHTREILYSARWGTSPYNWVTSSCISLLASVKRLLETGSYS